MGKLIKFPTKKDSEEPIDDTVSEEDEELDTQIMNEFQEEMKLIEAFEESPIDQDNPFMRSIAVQDYLLVLDLIVRLRIQIRVSRRTGDFERASTLSDALFKAIRTRAIYKDEFVWIDEEAENARELQKQYISGTPT